VAVLVPAFCCAFAGRPALRSLASYCFVLCESNPNSARLSCILHSFIHSLPVYNSHCLLPLLSVFFRSKKAQPRQAAAACVSASRVVARRVAVRRADAVHFRQRFQGTGVLQRKNLLPQHPQVRCRPSSSLEAAVYVFAFRCAQLVRFFSLLCRSLPEITKASSSVASR